MIKCSCLSEDGWLHFCVWDKRRILTHLPRRWERKDETSVYKKTLKNGKIAYFRHFSGLAYRLRYKKAERRSSEYRISISDDTRRKENEQTA